MSSKIIKGLFEKNKSSEKKESSEKVPFHERYKKQLDLVSKIKQIKKDEYITKLKTDIQRESFDVAKDYFNDKGEIPINDMDQEKIRELTDKLYDVVFNKVLEQYLPKGLIDKIGDSKTKDGHSIIEQYLH